MSSNASSDVIIRIAKREDCDAILDLKKELAIHSNMDGIPMLSAEELQRDGFDSDPPLYHCLVAEILDTDEDNSSKAKVKLVGYALYFFTYSLQDGKALFLEDICVSSKVRGKGLGSKLMKQLATIALEANCGRMQLEVGNWNASAIKFYDSHGGWNATTKEGWHNFGFDREAIRKLVQKP